MPRTTIHIEDDALRAAKQHAARHRIPLGKAVSELVLQGAERPLITDVKNGFPVVRLPGKPQRVTAALVKRLADEWP